MEVLIRWRCHRCPQEATCSYCNGKGYQERWVPYLVLEDVRALYKDTFVIQGRRMMPDQSRRMMPDYLSACLN
jgi:hypothetical protein